MWVTPLYPTTTQLLPPILPVMESHGYAVATVMHLPCVDPTTGQHVSHLAPREIVFLRMSRSDLCTSWS